MLFVFDETELEHRQKLQMLGNMQLIVELFKHEQISSVILNSTIDGLMQDINDQNLEILCKMVLKLAESSTKKLRLNQRSLPLVTSPRSRRTLPRRHLLTSLSLTLSTSTTSSSKSSSIDTISQLSLELGSPSKT